MLDIKVSSNGDAIIDVAAELFDFLLSSCLFLQQTKMESSAFNLFFNAWVNPLTTNRMKTKINLKLFFNT